MRHVDEDRAEAVVCAAVFRLFYSSSRFLLLVSGVSLALKLVLRQTLIWKPGKTILSILFLLISDTVNHSNLTSILPPRTRVSHVVWICHHIYTIDPSFIYNYIYFNLADSLQELLQDQRGVSPIKVLL